MLKKIEKLTGAEEAILAASGALLPPDAARAAAANALRERGLPTRRVEAWHYTDLRNSLKEFAGLPQSPSDQQAGQFLAANPAICPSVRLPFLDGHFLAGAADALPGGVSVTPGAAASGYRNQADAIALLNSMLAVNGARIAIDRNIKLDQPLALVHGSTGPDASVLRHAVELDAGAHATIIEQHASADGVAAHCNTVTGLTLGEAAQATWVIVQQESDTTTHLVQLNVTLGAGSRLAILVLNAGGKLVRREINVMVRGEGSELKIRGVNLIGGKAHVDVTTSLYHEVPETVSTEIFRNVVTDQGRGVFQGEIRVAQIAQKTDARMACNTLLLSDEAEFSAKPELEIFADDVQCAHGNALGAIDETALFYMRQRGLPEAQARAILIRSFLAEPLDRIRDPQIRDSLLEDLVTGLEVLS